MIDADTFTGDLDPAWDFEAMREEWSEAARWLPLRMALQFLITLTGLKWRAGERTHSPRLPCSGDVPFCPMKRFLGWTLTQVRSSSSTFYLLVYLFSCCTQEQVGDMINFCWHLLNSCHLFHCEIIEILKNSNKLETHALKKTWDAAALYHSF